MNRRITPWIQGPDGSRRAMGKYDSRLLRFVMETKSMRLVRTTLIVADVQYAQQLLLNGLDVNFVTGERIIRIIFSTSV